MEGFTEGLVGGIKLLWCGVGGVEELKGFADSIQELASVRDG